MRASAEMLDKHIGSYVYIRQGDGVPFLTSSYLEKYAYLLETNQPSKEYTGKLYYESKLMGFTIMASDNYIIE